MAAQIIAFPAERVFRTKAEQKDLTSWFKECRKQLPHEDHKESFISAMMAAKLDSMLKKNRQEAAARKAKEAEETALEALAESVAERVRVAKAPKRRKKGKVG